MKLCPPSSPNASRWLKYLCLGAGVLGLLAACERTPLAATPAVPNAQSSIAPEAAGVERNARAHLAAQDRIIEQQLANRRAQADVRGVGAQMQERLQRETQARMGETKRDAGSNSGKRQILTQSQSPSLAPTPKDDARKTEDQNGSVSANSGALPSAAPGKP